MKLTCHANEVICIQVNKPTVGSEMPRHQAPREQNDLATRPFVTPFLLSLEIIYSRMLINGILKIKSLNQRKILTPSIFLLLINNAFVNLIGKLLVCIPTGWYLTRLGLI